MPTYTIQGVEVDFPYEAYDCQLAYMEKVILALKKVLTAMQRSCSVRCQDNRNFGCLHMS